MYELVGKFFEMELQAERFDRVEDYTKQLALVPVSALTGEGIPELLMVLIGLAQKYLAEGLKFDPNGPAKGVILEVKETTGLGKTIDVIIFDGKLKKNDTIVIGGLDKPIVTKIRAILEPSALQEMMEKKTKYNQCEQVTAATGVKISAPDLDKVIAGMPIRSCKPEELEKVKHEIQELVEEVVLETEEEGLILKANALGSLEALKMLCTEKQIPIRKALIGDVSKKDVLEAMSNKDIAPLLTCVLAFNVIVPSDVTSYAKDNDVKIIESNIIYKLIEDYEEWKKSKLKELEAKELETVTRPCKLLVLKGYVFRQSNPAVCGVEVLEGKAKTGMTLMKKDGRKLDTIKGIQKEKENVDVAEKGEQVAMSFPKTTIGRQLNEEDILYSSISEEEFKQLKELKAYLTPREKDLLREIADIMRKDNSTWGI